MTCAPAIRTFRATWWFTFLVACGCVLGPVRGLDAQTSFRDGRALTRPASPHPPAAVDHVTHADTTELRGVGAGRAPSFAGRHLAAPGTPLPVPQLTPDGEDRPPVTGGDPSAETLEEAWRLALAVDHQRLAAGARVGAARSARDAAAAGRYPSAMLAGQYTVRDNTPSYLIHAPPLPGTLRAPYMQAEDFGFDGRIDVPLYQGGRVASDIAAAESVVQATQFQRARHELDLKLAVAAEYVAVLRTEQTLLLAQSHERSLAAHAADVELYHEQERVPLNDLLAAQVAWCDAKHHVIRARSERESACAGYNRLLGRPLVTPVRLTPLAVSRVASHIEPLTATAVAQRPELSELDAHIAAHRHRAERALAENRAQVHLQGAYSFQENRFQDPEGITSAGVVVGWNLFDGGRARSAAEEQYQHARALAYERADVKSHIELEVRRAYLAVEECRQRLIVTHQAIERAEEALRVTRQRYASGMATNTDVLTAETLRVRTYHNHNNSVYDAVLAEMQLKRATATL